MPAALNKGFLVLGTRTEAVLQTDIHDAVGVCCLLLFDSCHCREGVLPHLQPTASRTHKLRLKHTTQTPTHHPHPAPSTQQPPTTHHPPPTTHHPTTNPQPLTAHHSPTIHKLPHHPTIPCHHHLALTPQPCACSRRASMPPHVRISKVPENWPAKALAQKAQEHHRPSLWMGPFRLFPISAITVAAPTRPKSSIPACSRGHLQILCSTVTIRSKSKRGSLLQLKPFLGPWSLSLNWKKSKKTSVSYRHTADRRLLKDSWAEELHQAIVWLSLRCSARRL